MLREGELSRADLKEVLAARGTISDEVLIEFARDQIKEGRKGKDLKDDLLTFIRLLKEKRT